jgi:hypothetical protein
MTSASVQIVLSEKANEIITSELEKLNNGKVRRRGDAFVTKSRLCSEIIDRALGIKK